jgi:hypothetical protein
LRIGDVGEVDLRPSAGVADFLRDGFRMLER